ncbi:uncharacterized protein LOC126824167 isoform X2 [Patella vulgata]|uniref:uncharacterized protein LOC126824167 isoform X2 n=1 Tax=Patella vulgata TaxID=6465 RepID=UPI0024A813C1|nr:uncharacterized protein LOC126824167 isoform X2 [Patella vulgata]
MHQVLTKKGLHVGHLNVQYFFNKIPELSLSIQNFDIFAISESHLTTSIDDDQLHIAGFHNPLRKDKSNLSSSGTLLYIKDNFIYKHRSDLEHPNIESIWIELNLKKSKPILICCIYRNPASTKLWIDSFSEMMESAWNNKNEILIIGDLNIDLYKNQNKHWTDLLQTFGLRQLIKAPTRVTDKTKTLIDHLIVSDPDHVKEIKIPCYAASDHYPVCFTWQKKDASFPKNKHVTITYRSFKHFNKDQFLYDLHAAPFDYIYNYSDLNLALSIITPIINKHAPLKTTRVRNVDKPVWLTHEIFQLIHKRDYLKKKGDVTNYKKLRNEVKTAIRASKRKYLESLISDRENSKQIWDAIKLANNTFHKTSSQPTQMDPDTLNHYFINVANNLMNNVPISLSKNDSNCISNFVNNQTSSCTPKCKIPFMSTCDVYKYHSNLDASKSVGIDSVSSFFSQNRMPHFKYLSNIYI